MNPMLDAIKKKRMSAMPEEKSAPPSGESAPAEGDQGPDLEELLASLAPEKKAELFQLLQKELTGDGEQPSEQTEEMSDDAGQLKSTPGEKAALQGGMNMDVANQLNEGPVRTNQNGKPLGLSDRVKMNIQNMMKKKG